MIMLTFCIHVFLEAIFLCSSRHYFGPMLCDYNSSFCIHFVYTETTNSFQTLSLEPTSTANSFENLPVQSTENVFLYESFLQKKNTDEHLLLLPGTVKLKFPKAKRT